MGSEFCQTYPPCLLKSSSNLVSLSWEGAWGHENHSFITCHTTVILWADLLGWHNLLDSSEFSMPSDWSTFSFPYFLNVIVHCAFCTWMMFLTHHQWWWIWTAKCDDTVGLNSRGRQRRKTSQNDRNACKTLPSISEKALHSSALQDFRTPHFQPLWYIFRILVLAFRQTSII